MILLAVGLRIALVGQTADGVKSLFNDALIHSEGAKLHAALSAAELKGISAKACGQFLTLVTKSRLRYFGSFDKSKTKFLGITDPQSPMTIRFLPTGGATVVIQNNRKYAFEPTVIKVGKDVKASTGFATIAFLAAKQQRATIAGYNRRTGAQASHDLVKSWVPQFLKMGINGSIDPEIGRYLTWNQILASSQKEIDKMISRGR